MDLVDGYSHLGMPRFLPLETYLPLADAFGIRRAVVCCSETCPDLATVHRAIARDPARFRGFGLALGRDRAEVERAVHAQLDAGFAGLRLSKQEARDKPFVLDILGARGGVALMVSPRGQDEGAPALLRFLDRWPEALALCGNFGGPAPVSLLEEVPEVRALFAHPRCCVVFSRQGAHPPALVEAWAEALLHLAGWERVMWGSEIPTIFWRDQPLAPTTGWIDRFAPSPAEKQGFLAGNGLRLLFAGPPRPVAPLRLGFDPWPLEQPAPAPSLPQGLDLPRHLPGRLVAGWLAWGGERRGPLAAHLAHLLDGALPDA